MNMTNLAVSADTKVTLHFELSLEDGSIVDSTFDSEPAAFEFGDGNLPSGFESLLEGLESGTEERFSVPPEKAFGMPNPNNMQTFKRTDFAADMELAEGLVISFADANQSELPGVVKSFDESKVVIDFNHPLAGETLSFRVKIINVESL